MLLASLIILCLLGSIGFLLEPVRAAFLSILLLSLAILILCTLAFQKMLAYPKPEKGLLYLLTTFTLIRLLTLGSWLRLLYKDQELLQPLFTDPSSATLWDIIWNTLFIFLATAYFYKRIRLKNHGQWSHRFRLLFGIGVFLSLGLGLIGIEKLFQSYIIDSQLNFNFDNVFLLDWRDLIAILSALVFLLSFFLFSQQMIRILSQIEQRQKNRMLALLCALAGLSIFHLFYISSTIPIYVNLLLFLLFFLISDLYVDYKGAFQSAIWGIAWIFLLALFSTANLFSANLEKDQRIRLSIAKALCQKRDHIAEKALRQIIQYGDAPSSDIASIVPKQTYLFYNYRWKPAPTDSTDGLLSVAPNIWLDTLSVYYQYRVQLSGTASTYSFYPVIENQRALSNILFPRHELKGINAIGNYQIAIFSKQEVVLQNAAISNHKEKLSAGQWIDHQTSRRSILSYQAYNNLIAVVAKARLGYIQPISLFSYLFVLLLILVLVWSIAHRFNDWLPQPLLPLGKWNSLSSRIQLSFLGLFILSFIIIGGATVYFSNNTNKKEYTERLGQQLRQIRKAVESKLQLTDTVLNDAIAYSVSSIHEQDLLLYDLNGRLKGVSLLPIKALDLISRQMNQAAKTALMEGQHYALEKETINNTQLTFAYIPLSVGTKPVGYMAIPYFENTRQRNQKLFALVSTLLNVYVMLLLITASLAITISQYITRPLTQLGQRLQAFNLKKNEPIAWHRSKQDELGELISAYNQMVAQLDISTRKLKQSEREGAWREMAKQVAHEIKNPLTPMKLSIQHLQRAYRSQPEAIEPILRRVANTLIEQIDGLSRIASDFSNFAKMPQPENSRFQLHEVIQSVFELFKNHETIQFELDMPEKPVTVSADKEHLTRVLNNLIKNAIQAIPDEREGKIAVRLYTNETKATISVTDNGIGIAEALQEKVFSPNFTTKSSGTGLGLAISQNSIEAAKGRIYFHTQIGVGTTFFVELPLA